MQCHLCGMVSSTRDVAPQPRAGRGLGAPANLLAMAILFHWKSRQTHQHGMKVAALDQIWDLWANSWHILTWSLGTPTDLSTK